MKEDYEQLSAGRFLGGDNLALQKLSPKGEIDGQDRCHMRNRAPDTRGVALGLRMIVGVTGLCCHKDKQQQAQRDGRNLSGLRTQSGHRMMLSSSHYPRKTVTKRTASFSSTWQNCHKGWRG